MYISRVEINKTGIRTIKELNHVGAYHAWVENCFPEDFGKMPRPRRLWRIDEIGENRYLLIISETAPSIEILEQYGVTGSAGIKSYDGFINSIDVGQRMRFRVVLNTVTAISNGKGNRATSHVCVTEAEQKRYLSDRSRANGFSVKEEDYAIINKSSVILKKRGMKPVELIKVTYEGLLTITDRTLFVKAITGGIGKHKAYGFGMMTAISVES